MHPAGVTVEVSAQPSEQAVKMRVSEATVTDPAGRIIKLKRPGVLAQYRLIEMLGDSASNQAYLSLVAPLAYVVRIDDAPVLIATKKQLEALIQQLDEDGIAAVMAGVKEHFGATDPAADREALKK